MAGLSGTLCASLGFEACAAYEEGVVVGDELGEHLGDARPVETLLRPLVAAAQHVIEVDVEVLRHRVQGEEREEQVDVDAVVVEGDDGHGGARDRTE